MGSANRVVGREVPEPTRLGVAEAMGLLGCCGAVCSPSRDAATNEEVAPIEAAFQGAPAVADRCEKSRESARWVEKSARGPDSVTSCCAKASILRGRGPALCGVGFPPPGCETVAQR